MFYSNINSEFLLKLYIFIEKEKKQLLKPFSYRKNSYIRISKDFFIEYFENILPFIQIQFCKRFGTD